MRSFPKSDKRLRLRLRLRSRSRLLSVLSLLLVVGWRGVVVAADDIDDTSCQ
jgi:hypothetical protein